MPNIMNKGQVLVAAVFILIVAAILGVVAVSMLSSGGVSAIRNLNGTQALDVAEGGIYFTIVTSLAADSDFTDNTDFGPVSLGPFADLHNFNGTDSKVYSKNAFFRHLKVYYMRKKSLSNEY